MYVYIYSMLHTSGWVHVFKVPYGDFCYKYHRSCFFCVDFIYANYARERKFT